MANNDLLVLKNKEVLVTGGCGFIGSEIVKQLSQIGANVTVVDNLSSGKEKYIQGLSNVNLIVGDLLDQDVIKSAVKDKEYVINNAALPFIPDSYYIPKKFFEVNVDVTISMALAVINQTKPCRNQEPSWRNWWQRGQRGLSACIRPCPLSRPACPLLHCRSEARPSCFGPVCRSRCHGWKRNIGVGND